MAKTMKEPVFIGLGELRAGRFPERGFMEALTDVESWARMREFFGLSFDEIIVTTFTAGPGITTLPIWIYQNLFRPNQAPIVNVVAAFLVIVSILPIYIVQKFSSTDERGGGVM